MLRFELPNATHTYHVDVAFRSGRRTRIEVYARNRTQADAFAKRRGFTVQSVKMVG